MRHRVYGKHLGRTKNQRTALFRNLARSLFLFGRIETTETKAKAIRGLVDRLITQAKSPTTRRLVSGFLSDKQVAERLFNELVPKLGGRVSGYTSIIKLGRRLGDSAIKVQMNLLTEEKPEISKGTSEEQSETSTVKKDRKRTKAQ